MTSFHRQMSIRLLCGTAIVAATTIGCQSAERRSNVRQIARAPFERLAEPAAKPAPAANDYYVPPALDEIPPVPMPSTTPEKPKSSAPPPPPVPAVGDNVTWSLDRAERGTLKPVSNTTDDTPGLLSPGRVRSIRDFITGRDANTIR